MNTKQQSDKLQHFRIQNAIESIVQMIVDSQIEKDNQKNYLKRLAKLDSKLFESLFNTKITAMDTKYIICFAIDLDVKSISVIFNVEPTSVHTARYRIRKKCAKENLPF